MKTSTKIFFILFVLSLVPALWLGQYVLQGIVPTDSGFTFDFSTAAYFGIACICANVIFGSILFSRFIKAQPLPRALLFSILPISLLYGALIFVIADVTKYTTPIATSIKTVLNLADGGTYNAILWAVLVSIVYMTILSLIFYRYCKPLGRVEKIASRLSDGRTGEQTVKVGGGKQFKDIENSLNKINQNYYAQDGKGRQEGTKNADKALLALLGKEGVSTLEEGKPVAKVCCALMCKLKSNFDSESLSLEENFKFVSSYYNIVTPIIRRFGGYVERFGRSGIFALFSQSEAALDCASAIIKTVSLKNRSSAGFKVEASASVGAGEFTLVLGGGERGGAGIANSIENFEKMQEVGRFLGCPLVFSNEVLSLLPTKYKLFYRYIGSLKEGSLMPLYESLEVYGREEKNKLASLKNEFEAGVRLYNEGDFGASKEKFAYVLRLCPSDKAGYVYFNEAAKKQAKVL